MQIYTDAHIHILDIIDEIKKNNRNNYFNSILLPNILFCASSDSADRFIQQEEYCKQHAVNSIQSFGVHPQNPIHTEIDFLEQLIIQKRISAIGECGFDLFEEKFKKTLDMQKAVWNKQIELAKTYGLPVIIHCRKALPLIFDDVPILKKLPAVIFHGWGGSKIEAHSFLKKGVNAFFCIGKNLLRGQKNQFDTALNIEESRLLTETDAPYMSLKNEIFSVPSDITKVAYALATIIFKKKSNLDINIPNDLLNEFLNLLYKNFKTAFNLKT